MDTKRNRVSRRAFAARAGGLVPLVVMFAVATTGCAKQEQPNVLLYVIDTLRADVLQPYGGDLVDTPAIQRLAAEGILFESAYAQSSWTRPSITSILTGLTPDAHGVEARHHGAPPELRMLAEFFRDAGYATGAVVTNPNVGRFFGFDQGYDEFIELFAHNPQGSAAGYGAKSHLVTARAIEWIRGVSKPFFLVLHTTDPHWPYDPPERFDPLRSDPALANASREIEATRAWSEEEQRALHALYRGEIASNDDAFGTLLAALRRDGTYDGTLIVLTSDHGEEFGEHGDKGHGKTLFEEQVLVPLILRRPQEPQPGARIAVPVQLVDLAPTILALAGLEVPDELRGRVLPPDGAPSDRSIYASLRLDGLQGQMLFTPPWKMIHHTSIRERETGIRSGLFDLSADPGETHDLSLQEPELAREMRDRLDRIAIAVKKRAAESRARRKQANSGAASGDAEMPDRVRRSLEALGYLEPAD